MKRQMQKLFLLFMVCSFPGLIARAQLTDRTSKQLYLQIQKSKPDTNRVKLQLQLGKYYLDKPNENKKDLDSAYLFFNQAIKLSDVLHTIEWRNKGLILTALCDEQAGNIPHAKTCVTQVIDYYHKVNNQQQEAENWNTLGKLMLLDNKTNISYKLQCFKNALSIYRQTHNKRDEIGTLKNIAEVHFNTGKLEQAENELVNVLSQYKAIGYTKLNDTYDLLAEINKSKPDLHKELFYRLELIKGMEATADTARADYYYAKLALVYSDLGMFDQSLTQILRSIQILKQRSKFEDFYGDLSLVMYDFISEGKAREGLVFLQKSVKEVPPQNLAQSVDMNEEFANCYKSLKQYDKAEQYYLEMMRLFKITSFNKDFYSANSQMVTDYIYYNQTLGQFYLLTKQFQKAAPYVDKLLLLPKDAVRPVSLRKILLMKFRVDSASGNYLTAIRYFELYKNLNDSLFNVTKSQQIAEMNVKYETDKKEQSIKVLNSQSKVQHAELQKANLQRNITLAGIIMLIIVSGIVYNGYRNKRQSNQLLQSKQAEINRQNKSLQLLLNDKDKLLLEKDWLLKEVHHRVKNNLQIVMSLLNTQSAYLENNAAITAIRDSQNRVQAISLIHQKLYSTSNVASIDMGAYISDLVNYLRDCLDTVARHIRFEIVVEDIRIDLTQAVPLGLILNEAVTNAIKYAFDEKGGNIIIALQWVGSENLLLTVADDGIGLPQEFDISKTTSLGMELMKALSKQLGGTFEMRSKPGVTVMIDFQVERIIDDLQHESNYI